MDKSHSGYDYSARHIYLAIKYLKNIDHYDDEDGWINPDPSAVGKYTYKWVLHFVHNHSGSPEDLWRDLFMAESALKELCKRKKITMIDQLMFYAREWEKRK
ncbi:hypothetical protein SAMN02910292_02874 [Lachnospiraceae bacterium XBB2008]|nr:hypothetical protein SAMN02910292_02874 [Lachnospiraceae bacterium XBB2008]